MPKASVTQATISRAVKAVQAAGLPVERVEIDQDGRLVIFTGNADNSMDETQMTPLELRRARRGQS